MTPVPYMKSSNGTYQLTDVCTAIKTVGAKYGIPVLDTYTEGQFELEMHQSHNDGIHPSQNHHRDYLAPLITEFILKNWN